jgi:predicted ATPase/DNA-binding SARP family transcriptional activator
MDFRVLGPVEVAGTGRTVRLGRRERGLLAALVLSAGKTVSSDRLVDALWGERPPRTAGKTLQTYVLRLRKALGGSVIETQAPGYRLFTPVDAIDAHRFEELIRFARTAAVNGAPARAATSLRDALHLWRGNPFEELAGWPAAEAEAARLGELRRVAAEELADAELACGRHAEYVAELESMVAAEPLRERRWAMLMLALYRCGRQADALRAYQRARTTLVEELGIEPGPELRALEQAVVAQDASLAPPSTVIDPERVPPAPRDGGIVFILFSDLAGSTELLGRLGDDAADELRRTHFKLLRDAVDAHGGQEVKTLGDGLMVVFTSAVEAVSCAVEIQRAVTEHNRASSQQLDVRVGLHVGEPIRDEDDFFGMPVVVAQRLCDAASPEQILASETVRSLVGSRGGHDFVALGELDLKGLPPLATVAVRWCDDAPVFAPAGRAKGNLPASLDRFVGRQHDIDVIRALLRERRLVTLTGPGGSGKTRLALEVAHWIAAEHADGVWLVDLAPVDDDNLIAEATMAALGLRGGDAAARDVLLSHLAGRDTLLLVDNCEHVLGGAAPLIAELLTACPLMGVLATSREALRVPGEAEYAVEGLRRAEAIELFAERVPGRRRIDDPGAIERICAALEGIPLALELAAAKLRVLSLAELADRLDDQLAVLARGSRTAPERQRTLRATLDWSYDLLDEDERTVFRRLGIFAGGFTPDAAEQVVADEQIPRARIVDVLEQLIERSLLTRVPAAPGARFRLLEPVRQYAGERLGQAGERNALAQRHLEWVKHFARGAFLEFFVSQRESNVRISEEHPNICQALEFAIGNRDGVTAAKVIDAIGFPWYMAGQPDARLWCERVLAVVPTDAPAVTRAGALVATAMMLQEALQYDPALSLLREARELYRSAKSVRGEAWAVTWLGRDAFYRAPASAEARALFEEALSRHRESDVPAGAGWCLAFLAFVALHAEDDELARRRAEEAVQLGRSAHIGQVVGQGLRLLAVLDSRAGDFENADRRLAELIAIHEAASDRFQLVAAHVAVAEQAASRGDVARAARHLAAGAGLAREMQSSELALDLVASAAYTAYMDGRAGDAAVLFGACLGLSPSTFPKRFRPIVEALEAQGLREEIAAGATLSPEEALESVIDVASRRPAAPA